MKSVKHVIACFGLVGFVAHYAAASDGRFSYGTATVGASNCADTPRPPTGTPYDTHQWFGAEYTPSLAGGNAWLAYPDQFWDQVHSDLSAASKVLGYNTIRLFLHSHIFRKDEGKTLFEATDKTIEIASQYGIKVGLVLYDDCHRNTELGEATGNLTHPCKPENGYHNGEREMKHRLLWVRCITCFLRIDALAV